MRFVNPNGKPKLSLDEDGKGGKIIHIERDDTRDAVVIPAPIGMKAGIDTPGSDADLNLLAEVAYAVPTVHANLRVLKLGRDYGDAAGQWIRLEDVIGLLQREALLQEQSQHVLMALARAILRAVGKET